MTPEERAAAEELLSEVVAGLKALRDSKADSADDTRLRLEEVSIDLRRRLYEDAPDRSSDEPKQPVGADLRESPAVNSNTLAIYAGASTDRVSRLEQQSREELGGDFSVSRPMQLVVLGVCILAWVIEPERTDHPLALSLLMFLRFVPAFIVGGILCGRVARGAAIGTALFFILMMTDSLSLLTWDFQRIILEDFKTVRHATNLATILFVFGGLGLAVTVAAILAHRQNKSYVYERYIRLSLQALVAVQLAFVVELGYTSLRQFSGADRHHVGLMTTLKITPHRTHRSR